MTPEGLERLMRAVDNLYGVDYPPCTNCGHAPKEHGRAAMQCEAYSEVATGYADTHMLLGMVDVPCDCDCYDEPEGSRRTHGYTR